MKKFYYFISLLFLLSTTLFSQDINWTWQNPYPNGSSINDVIVLSHDKYILFADAGAITIINGSSIQTQFPDTANRSIYEADFIDSSLGYVCGVNGLIMKTTDGGLNWSILTSNSTANFWYIRFLNANTGFVCGTASTLLKTTDGGLTWNPIVVSATSSTLYNVYFQDALTGYIGGSSATVGYLLKTTDGGDTWAKVTGYVNTNTVRGICFTDANTGYVTTANYSIDKTTDGGATWNRINLGTGTLYDIFFWTPSEGYTIGADGQFFKTTDAGANWNLTDLWTDNNANLFGMDMENILGGNPLMVVAGEAGVIAKTTDFGSTWRFVSISPTRELLRSIDMVNSTLGYAAGGNTTDLGIVLKTNDGGSSWNALPFNPGYQIYSLEAIGSVLYVGVTGPNGIYKSINGGLTFSQLVPGGMLTTGYWYGLSFVDENIGFATGSNGYTCKTINGGDTWTELTDNNTSAMYDIQAVDANFIAMCGVSAKVLVSTDGGTTWTPRNVTPSTATVYSVCFLDGNNGWAAGTTGRVWKTTDGGVTWVLQTIPTFTGTLYRVKFINNNLGFIAGASGYFAFTTDGGTTWKRTVNHTSYDIRSISVMNSSVWTSGDYGSILNGDFSLIPVELASFSASVNENDISLNWQTVTEKNNKGFTLEKKVNGIWNELGFISGNGTTTERMSYSFTDKNPAEGKNIYRLKQINLDGSYEYIGQIEVDFNNVLPFELAQNYPNPFNPTTSIRFILPTEARTTIKLYNSLGEEVKTLFNEVTNAGVHTINIDASNLSSGMYIYKIVSGEYSASKKMILMK